MEFVRTLPGHRSRIGEGPHWDERNNCLFYVDLLQGTLYRSDTLQQNEETFHIENSATTFCIPYESDPNSILISKDKQILKLKWDTKEATLLAEVEPDVNTRFNDGKCDPAGRLWAGTMGLETSPGIIDQGLGSLYSMDASSYVVKHLSGITISNGLAWSRDSRIMFYVDSFPRKIYALDYDLATGSIAKQRDLVDFNKASKYSDCGLPDGITLDAEGKLWVACFGGGRVLRIDPQTGELIRTVFLPTKRITSCCFGGPNYSDLYVTSAYYGLNEKERSQDKDAGAVFKVSNLGVTGFAASCFAN